MATSQQNSLKIPDNLSIGATSESSAIPVSTAATLLTISSDTAVFFRLKTGENGFRIPANFPTSIDATDLRGKTIFFYNGTAGTAVVTMLVNNWTAKDVS